MKHAAITISIILAVAVVGLIVSLAASGSWSVFNNRGYFGYNSETGEFVDDSELADSVDKIIAEEYKDIDISVVSAKTIISISEDNQTYVEYRTNNNNSTLLADVKNNKLVVEERRNQVFSFGFNNIKSTLNIKIPEKVFNRIKYNTVSGYAEINGFICDELSINTTSGDINISAFGKDINVSTVSGDVDLANYTGENANSINVVSTSGSTTLSGYRPKSYKLSAVSGDVSLFDAAGKGEIHLTSGSAYVEYTVWNDSLNIDLISGGVEVRMPNESGAELNFSRTSGNVSYVLDEGNGDLNKSGDYNIGGANNQKVKVHLVSGHVNFYNTGNRGIQTETTTSIITEAIWQEG